jgi:hypothetical protein
MNFNRTEPGDNRAGPRGDVPAGDSIINGFGVDPQTAREGEGPRRRRRRDFPDPLSATEGKATSRIAKWEADVELKEQPGGVLVPHTGAGTCTLKVWFDDPLTGKGAWQTHRLVKKIIIANGFMTFITL